MRVLSRIYSLVFATTIVFTNALFSADIEDSDYACDRVFSLDRFVEGLRLKKIKMNEHISVMQQPLAHGTDSIAWESMVQAGKMKHDATTDGIKTGALCLSDLNKPDGLMASYGFAVREKWDLLEIRSHKSVVTRYSEVNPFFQGWFGPLKRYALNTAAKEYVRSKASTKMAYPVYLIFDGQNEIRGGYRRPKIVPSEFWVNNEISLDYLRIAFVPFRNIDAFKTSLISNSNIEVSILPIEIFELDGF